MPFTGGASPQPERYGGGEGINSNVPLLQRVYQSITRARGSAYDQSWPPTTAVGVENLAYARAITFDGWGTNQRLSNECNPGKSTAAGLLPRWERILNCPPNYGDTQPVRQARCAAVFALAGKASVHQAVADAIAAVLGPIFVSLFYTDETNTTAWWPGIAGVTGAITTVVGNIVTMTGTAGTPSSAVMGTITVSNCATAANNGTFQVWYWFNNSLQWINAAGVATDYGIGGTALSPTVNWAVNNIGSPWSSSIAVVNVLVTPQVAGYQNADGSPNSLFYQTVGNMIAVLDQILPAWMLGNWYTVSSHGVLGFYLDDPNNLDCEAFDV